MSYACIFEFDIREIVAKYPEKCYYSTGNLQTNAASVLKITETPDRLRLDYLYHDISDAKFLTNNYLVENKCLQENGSQYSMISLIE